MTWHPDIPEEYRNQIVTGDARELAKRIPDESIDLIFTDPVYDRIDDYRWLAETAARVLRPDSACLVWVGIEYKHRILDEMGRCLIYRWTLTDIHIGFGVGHFVNGYKCKQSHCLVFNGKPKRQMWDISFGVLNGSKWGSKHKWSKHPDTITRWIQGMSTKGATILDPFTGGGTVPAVCKMLQRNCIAFEIDPDTASLARQRVRDTQPPLPLNYAEQLDLI